MIVNTLACLIIVSMVGFLRVRMRMDRIMAWAMFLSTLFLFYNYVEQSLVGVVKGFSFVWSESKFGDITIDFFPSITSNYLIIPLFFIGLLTIFNNNIFRYEERRSVFNSLILLNFASVSLLISATNYVQLITSVFISDIIGYMLLKDVDSSRRYVIYNFFADMCLFMVLSLVSGRIESIELSKLLTYEQIGRHKDFVSIVTFLALIIKMGAFSFQSYLLDISSARFQRLSIINTFFCPFLGVLLLLKLHNLLTVSNLFYPMFKIMSVLTFVTGCVFFVLKDNILKKTVYFNMAGIGLLLIMLGQNSFSWRKMFSFYYIIFYLYNIMFFKLYLYQNRENNVSQMINASQINKETMMSILLLMAFLSNLFVSVMYKISLVTKSYIPFYSSLVIFIALTIVLNHIYKSPKSRRLDYLNKNPKRVFSFIINLLTIVLATYHFKMFGWLNFVVIVLFLLLIFIPVGTYFRKFYDNSFLQSNNLVNIIYYNLLVVPLMYLSRTLWLMVDTLFSEKLIENSISRFNRLGISLFFKLNKKQYLNIIMFIFLGLAIFVISYYKKELP